MNNDKGHQLDHMLTVLKRSEQFAKQIEDVDYEMIYVIAMCHDVMYYLDKEEHHILSAKFVMEDEFLSNYFGKDKLQLICEAIEDHRASGKEIPRNIYGKIVSSADRVVDINMPFLRTHAFTIKRLPDLTIDECVTRAYEHLNEKFGKNGYAIEKIYFEDLEYNRFIEELQYYLSDYNTFKKKYYLVNNINEYDYYTNGVDKSLKKYIENDILPRYDLNDKGHGPIHIKEVIKRILHLNKAMKLDLNENMLFTIAAFHDLNKFQNHEKHHLIAAQQLFNDIFIANFFKPNEIIVMKEAIEDHRSSKEDFPRSEYGKIISSADRNTSVEIVFIRSFFVGLERMSDYSIRNYLDFTHERLLKRYSLENPENMFYEDKQYLDFLTEIRELLNNKEQFIEKYISINNLEISKNMSDYINNSANKKVLK